MDKYFFTETFIDAEGHMTRGQVAFDFDLMQLDDLIALG